MKAARSRVTIVTILLSFASFDVLAAAWTDTYTISVFDTLGANNAYITLAGYQNAACDSNRIRLVNGQTNNYGEMFAAILSAFHSGTQVRFLINDVCDADRIMLTK